MHIMQKAIKWSTIKHSMPYKYWLLNLGETKKEKS